MSQKVTCNWKGKSGISYEYFVYELPQNFNKNQLGNYIYSKFNTNNRWVPIYIGQGDLGDRISDSHHQVRCIKSKGATHVHAHLNLQDNNRLSEETDLLAYYTNAYVPFGCNEKTGG